MIDDKEIIRRKVMNAKWGWGEKKFQWGGRREESMLIKKYADQWCKDNGYPIIIRKIEYNGGRKKKLD